MGKHIPVSDQVTLSALVEMQEVREELVRKVRKHVRTDEDAEDVVHNVICSALRRDPGEIRNPKAYLDGACWREVQEFYRRRVQCAEVDENVPEEEGKGPDRMYEKGELEELLRSLVDEFRTSLRNPKQGEAFALKMLEGWSYERIAAYLQVPKATVGTWIFRAKQEFRNSKAFTSKLRAYTD
jgi:RNA polymerase sigma factor (sigma-70 family)